MISEKQLLANRLNAQRSTGPRTAEGKARARQNATRHGLAGAGIGLPPEDSALCKERLARWSAELGPRSQVEAFLVERAVVASVRIDRCVHADFAIAQSNRRDAIRLFEEQEQEKIDEVLNDPEGPVLQRLLAFSTGCEWLISRWEDFRRKIQEQGSLSAQALRVLKSFRIGAHEFDLDQANDLARAGGEEANEARRQIYVLIDAEIAQVKTQRDELWTRNEAPQVRQFLEDRAFDASPRTMLLRRYETASHNDLHRALRELSRIRKGDLLFVQDLATSAPPEPAPEADPAPPESFAAAPGATPQAAFPNEAISASSASIPEACASASSSTSARFARVMQAQEARRGKRTRLESLVASARS